MPWIPPTMQAVPNLSPGLSQKGSDPDFDDQCIPKTYAFDLTEADTLNLNIRMADGTVGSITIKGSTIAQIIMDRNARAAAAPESETKEGEIQVGDDGLHEIPVIPLRVIGAEEILEASKRARNRLNNVVDNSKSPY